MKRVVCFLCLILMIGLFLTGTAGALNDQDLAEIQRAIEAKGARWQAGDNPIFRLSPEDQRLLCGALFESPEERAENLLPFKASGAKLPESFDWRDVDGVNWLTPIRNQSSCGSCVAFGAIAAFEGVINIYANSPGQDLDLSEQHIFSCGGGRCNMGWYPGAAADYLQEYGAPLESCLPYQARDVDCSQTCSDWESQVRKVSEWGRVPGSGAEVVEQMKIALLEGPLMGDFTVYDDFFSYSGGVYTYTWGEVAGGHCICIVGWDDADSCWIVKNSWGPGWGDHGYFRIRMGYNEVGIEGGCIQLVPEPAYSAYVELLDTEILDEAGNRDGLLDPGETFNLVVTLGNERTWSSLTDVTGWLLPADPRATLIDVQGSFPSGLPDGGTCSNDADPFVVQMVEEIGIAPLSFNLYVTGTAAGSQPYSTELDLQLPITTHLGGWPTDVASSVKCSPLVIWEGGGSQRLVAIEDNGLLHMWNKWGDEVAGFPVSAPGGNIWGSIALGDVDGDGAEEIVYGSRNDTLYAIHSDGTVAFKVGMGADILATPALADLDGNGGLELVFGTMDSKIHALAAHDKEYSNFPVTLGGPVMADAAVADLDGDGSLDIVVGASDGLIYAICAETGEFLPGFPVATGGAIWSSPVIADLDLDGKYEVIVGSDDRKLYAVRSTGELLFTYQTYQAIKSSPAVADLDGNNRLDVIFTDNDGNVYAVDYQGHRMSGWPYRSGGFMLSSPIVLDIDDDGALEVVVEAPGLKLIHLEADGSLHLELPIESSGVAISSPMVTDLDCDGDVEVALGVPQGVNVWNYPTPSTVDIAWPMYRGNPRRTGFIGDILTGRPESPVDWTGPEDFALQQNYPNPFNPKTTISYSLAQESQVRLSVFNVLGQEVISLAAGRQAAGVHMATWDGVDAGGNPVASGLYFCRLQAGDFVETRKMVLLR